MTSTPVVGILLVQAIWNLTAATCLLWDAKLADSPCLIDNLPARTLPN
jgi:hypothetical protein